MKSCTNYLNDNLCFVAMEYYGLVFNHTYLIKIDQKSLIALKICGNISLESEFDYIYNKFTKVVKRKSDLNSLSNYIDEKYIKLYDLSYLASDTNLSCSKANFKIEFSKIKTIDFKKTKKYGMGYIPHTGRIIVESDKINEFILLGNQDGNEILNLIRTKMNFR